MDSVRFQAHERLDLVDANALQGLVYKYISEALGGLMGNAAGALTSIEYTQTVTNGVYNIVLKPFQYYYSEPDLSSAQTYNAGDSNGTTVDGQNYTVHKRYIGQVISYDPNDGSQTDDTVDWTEWRNKFVSAATTEDDTYTYQDGSTKPSISASPESNLPILWARPELVETSESARREWSVSAQTEVPISINTRKEYKTDFKLSTDRPIPDSTDTNQKQYVAIARVVAYSFKDGNTSTATSKPLPNGVYLAPIYVWDNHFHVGEALPTSSVGTEKESPAGYGVSKFIAEDGTDKSFLPNTRAKPESFANGIKRANELAPFSNDGAVISPLGRGAFFPDGSADRAAYGGTGGTTNTMPKDPLGVEQSWPNPGSHYYWWKGNAGAISELDLANGGAVPTSVSRYGEPSLNQLSLLEENLRVDSDALWRLGIPHVLHLMRRQLSFILDSQTPVKKASSGHGSVPIEINTEGRPWYALPTDTGGLLQLRGDISSLEKKTDDQHVETVQHTRRDVDPYTSWSGCYIVACGEVSPPKEYHELQTSSAAELNADPALATFDGFGLTKVATGYDANGSYITWEVQNNTNFKIISIQVTQKPKRTALTGQTTATSASGLIHDNAELPIHYVSKGDLNNQFTSTQFTVHCAKQKLKQRTESGSTSDQYIRIRLDSIPYTLNQGTETKYATIMELHTQGTNSSRDTTSLQLAAAVSLNFSGVATNVLSGGDENSELWYSENYYNPFFQIGNLDVTVNPVNGWEEKSDHDYFVTVFAERTDTFYQTSLFGSQVMSIV